MLTPSWLIIINVISLKLSCIHNLDSYGWKTYDFRNGIESDNHSVSHCAKGSCRLNNLSMPSNGRYCIGNGPLARYVKLRVAHAPGMPGTFSPPLTSSTGAGKTFPAFPPHAQPTIVRIWQEAHGVVTHHVLPHQCRYMCLQSVICRAYNYNATDGTCTLFRTPCPQAFAEALMEFAVLTQKSSDECYQWIPYVPGDAIDSRMVYTDNAGLLPEFGSSQGYPCQRLRIEEDCTIIWVPYTAPDSIPQICHCRSHGEWRCGVCHENL